MSLTAQQRVALATVAKERGVDEAALIAEAEKIAAARDVTPTPAKPTPAPEKPVAAAGTTSAPEQPKLFQYHLPFVTVDEVRTIWLGLAAWGPDKGGDDVAAAFALKTAPPTAPVPADPAKSLPSMTALPGKGTAG